MALGLAFASLISLAPAAYGTGNGSSSENPALPPPFSSGELDQATTVPEEPNIVLITTDDQRWTDLRQMPGTRRVLQRHGTTMLGLSPNPLCCPARAEILTGQHSHNNGVRTNKGLFGGYSRLDPTETLATWLQTAGYTTIFLGKYLNGYRPNDANDPEVGWDSWHPTVKRTYNYRTFTVSHNGSHVEIDGRYQTDYFTRMAVKQIGRHAPSTRPFFLWQSYVAPHGGCQPELSTPCWIPPPSARRHRDLFGSARLDSQGQPGFNERDVSDKPRFVQALDRLGKRRIENMTSSHRARLRALAAVDEGVVDTVAALRDAGELRNTLIIFTSDNGYLLGEHRLLGKAVAYEPSIRVPFVMRGPGIPQAEQTSAVATLLDIPMTALAAAGGRPTIPVDGRDIRPVARGIDPSQSTVLIQVGPRERESDEEGWFLRGVRTGRYTFARYPNTGERELYDRKRDPFQVQSVHDNPRYRRTLNELRDRLSVLGSCGGAECWQQFGRVPSPTRR